jgi:tetratricopeptide (TPR) repeat protein
LGVQLLSYGERPEDIVRVFSSGEYQGIKKISELSQRLLFEVLKNDKTSQAERDLLLRFSVFRDKVPFEAIAALYDDPKIKYPLSQLIEKSLIRYKQKLYDCAPLIREFCQPLLEDAKVIHSRAADYFLTHRGEHFDPALEENIIFHLQGSYQWQRLGAYIEEYGKDFIKFGQVNLLNDTLVAMRQNGVEGPVFLVYEAEIFIHLSDFEKARKCIHEALDIYQKAGDKKGQSIALNVLGRVKWTTHLTDALESLEESYRLAEEMGDKRLMVSSLNLIANNYFEEGDLEKAKQWADRSLAIAEELKDQLEIATALNVKGRILSRTSNYDLALKYLEKSYTIFEHIGHKVMVVITMNNAATILFKIGEHDKALVEFQRCLEFEKMIGSKDRIATIYNNIGRVLLQLGDTQAALKNFYQCLKIQEEINYIPGIASALYAIGLVHFKNNNNDLGLEYFEKSLNICQQISYKIGLFNLYESIGELLISDNNPLNFEKACFYLLQSIALRRKMNVDVSKSEKLFSDLRGKIESAHRFQQLVISSSNMLPPELKASLYLDHLTGTLEE